MKFRQEPREFKDYQEELTNKLAIASNGNYIFPVNQKFAPFDLVEITNLNRNNDCIAVKNLSQKEILPSGNSIIIKNVNDLEIKNFGDTQIEIDQIRVLFIHVSKKQDYINKALNIAGNLARFI